MGWFSRRKTAGNSAPLQVVMYTRAGCHLCDEAWVLLEEMRAEYGFDLEAIEVDSKADLAGLYGERVPVVAVNGKERMWGKINRILLRRLFSA